MHSPAEARLGCRGWPEHHVLRRLAVISRSLTCTYGSSMTTRGLARSSEDLARSCEHSGFTASGHRSSRRACLVTRGRIGRSGNISRSTGKPAWRLSSTLPRWHTGAMDTSPTWRVARGERGNVEAPAENGRDCRDRRFAHHGGTRSDVAHPSTSSQKGPDHELENATPRTLRSSSSGVGRLGSVATAAEERMRIGARSGRKRNEWRIHEQAGVVDYRGRPRYGCRDSRVPRWPPATRWSRPVGTAERISKTLGDSPALLTVTLDVTSHASAVAAVQAAVDRFGRIDVLVNNAASFFAGYFEELTPEQVDQQLATSLIGPMNVTRAILPVMRQQRSGHIISISSSAGLAAGFDFVWAYAASKFELEGLMESLHAEVAPFGIPCDHRQSGLLPHRAPHRAVDELRRAVHRRLRRAPRAASSTGNHRTANNQVTQPNSPAPL